VETKPEPPAPTPIGKPPSVAQSNWCRGSPFFRPKAILVAVRSLPVGGSGDIGFWLKISELLFVRKFWAILEFDAHLEFGALHRIRCYFSSACPRSGAETSDSALKISKRFLGLHRIRCYLSNPCPATGGGLPASGGANAIVPLG